MSNKKETVTKFEIADVSYSKRDTIRWKDTLEEAIKEKERLVKYHLFDKIEIYKVVTTKELVKT